MRFVRNSLALAMLWGLFLVGCDGLSIDTVKRVAADVGGSGDTATAAEDILDDVADTAADMGVDTATDTATDIADTTDTTDTGVTVTNACGGTEPLAYRGAAAGPGDGCGLCGDGELYCSGTSGLSCAGASLPNACGGCGLLNGEIGTACGLCDDGVWACGAGQSECVGDRPPNGCGGCTSLALEPGTECALATGDAGVVVCSGRELSRCASAGTNGCGGTAPLTLPSGVTGVEPRPGVLYQSDCRRGVLLCDGAALVAVDLEGGNACGGCDPLLGEPGSACGACGGTWQCDAEGGVQCLGGSTNACGGCAGLEVQPGASCNTGSGSGVAVCISLEETACVAPGSTNACGGLGTITGDPLGQTCGACADGVVACDATDALRRSTVCEGASDLNSCGGCGVLDGTIGSACGTCGTGSYACAATSLVCTNDAGAAAENVCGGCSTLAANPGDPCGRCGTWACDPSATGRLACIEPAGGCGIVAVCGNGAVEAGEGCDDDGIIDGDGCSRSCVVESGYDCVGSPSSCSTVCGDGLLVGAEVCDEGDANGAGSCSVGCTCSVDYHLEGGVCTSDERACSVPNGTGTESWTGSSYGACVFQSCLSGFHEETATPRLSTLSFEAGATLAPLVSSAPAWTIDLSKGHLANGALRSGVTPNFGSTVVTLATSGPARPVSFWYTVSSEAGYDYLRFEVDGIEQGRWSGTVAWTEFTLSLSEGTHSLVWTYSKDGSGSWGADAAWIDEIEYSVPTDCGEIACGTTYCASDTRDCNPLPEYAIAGTQSWTAGTWGACEVAECEAGFSLIGNSCSRGLGSPCVVDAECDSGFCSTSPSGTDHDRCSPPGMVWIPGGTFTMGSPTAEIGRSVDESAHAVTISSAFFLDVTELSQAAWKALSFGINPSYFQNTSCVQNAFLGSNACRSTENSNDSGPVERVDWYSALEFANAKSRAEGLTPCYEISGCLIPTNGWLDGQHERCSSARFVGLGCTGYRLPTEAEWEFAARAGSSTATPRGNLSGSVTDCVTAQSNLDGIALWCKNSGTDGAGRRDRAVGGAANNWGLSDMLGNVSEWTWDLWESYPAAVTDPLGGSSGTDRVYRGGSFTDVAGRVRAAQRFRVPESTRSSAIGFRLARTAP